MIAKICHQLLAIYGHHELSRFKKNLTCLESTQRQVLSEMMTGLSKTSKWSSFSKDSSYENLIQKIPVRSYLDFSSEIDDQRQSKKPVLTCEVVRFEPTSGSTQSRKWIPYSKAFLKELNTAAIAWMGDLYQNHPEIKNGRHYWSLSWLPQELRSLTSSDDSELFPWYQRVILQKTMASSPKIASLPDADAAWWATLVSLASCKDLTLVSVWSPTFWLKVIEDLQIHWEEISHAVSGGQWGRYQDLLKAHLGQLTSRDLRSISPLQKDFLNQLWPQLKIITSWDSSTSTSWALKIKILFPHVTFQGKGLWATEGVVTIPFQEKKVLALNSHFFEFRDLESQEIFPSWNLTLGREYQPILWTSTGLLRYALPDRLRMTSTLKGTPCFEFIGRLQSVDLVGEKISAEWVQNLFSDNLDWQAWALVASANPAPKYYLFHRSDKNIEIDAALSSLHHYKVAREIGQLHKAEAIFVSDFEQLLRLLQKGSEAGRNKIEILYQVEKLIF